MRKTILLTKSSQGFDGPPGRNLEKLIGLNNGLLPRFFDLVKSEELPAMKKCESLIFLHPDSLAKFGLKEIPLCQWVTYRNAELFHGAIPYPSAHTPWYMDRDNWKAARWFMKLAAIESWLHWANEYDGKAWDEVIAGSWMLCPEDNNVPDGVLEVTRRMAALQAAIAYEARRGPR